MVIGLDTAIVLRVGLLSDSIGRFLVPDDGCLQDSADDEILM